MSTATVHTVSVRGHRAGWIARCTCGFATIPLTENSATVLADRHADDVRQRNI